LPELRLPVNQVNLKAEVTLESDGDLAVQKVMLASRQGGVDWLELSAEKAVQPGLAVVGKMDLGVAHQNVPAAAPYVSAGSLLLKANVGEPKDGMRKLGFSAEAQGLTLTLPEVGSLTGLQTDAQGILTWGADGLAALDDLNLTAQSAGKKLILGKVDYRKNGALAWESLRAPAGWMAVLARPWLEPNRWLDGDLELGPGFWEPGDHGASGEIDARLVRVRISEPSGRAPLSARLQGSWEYDNRTRLFLLKDTSLLFSGFQDDPVLISRLEAGPGLFTLKVSGGTLDSRGLLDQYGAWQAPTPRSQTRPEPTRVDISANLDQVILREAQLERLQIKALKFGPDEFLLDDFSASVVGGYLAGFVHPLDSGGRKIFLEAKNFPVGMILSPFIQDVRGPIGGFADLEFSGQAVGVKPEDLIRTFSGQGSLRIYQARLENVPAIQKNLLQEAGRSLGSQTFIPSSNLDSFVLACSLQNSQLSISEMQITGSALQLGLAGIVNLSTRELNLKGPLGLTREAIQSCGVLQGMVLKDNFAKSNELYVKMPGELEVTGTLDNPTVNFDKLKAFWRGALNLGIGFIQGTGDAATGAAGAALGAPGSILQGVGNLFKGF